MAEAVEAPMAEAVEAPAAAEVRVVADRVEGAVEEAEAAVRAAVDRTAVGAVGATTRSALRGPPGLFVPHQQDSRNGSEPASCALRWRWFLAAREIDSGN